MGKFKGVWKVASAGLTGAAAGAGYGTSRAKGNSVPRSIGAGAALGGAGAGFKFTKKGAAIGASTLAGGSSTYDYLALHKKPKVGEAPPKLDIAQQQLHSRQSTHTGIDHKSQQHWNS